MRQQNPRARNSVVQTRVNNEELHAIHVKAHAHTQGDISKFMREAALNYKPIKKVERKEK